MNLEDVREINDLFSEFYPYIVDQIMEEYKREELMKGDQVPDRLGYL